MLYRHEDGTYTASSLDGEWRQRLSKEEGDAALAKQVDMHIFARIMTLNICGFMPSRIVELLGP